MKCFVCGAKNAVESWLSFHRFPTNKELLKKWANVCDIEESNIPSSARICSKHFKEDDYDESFFKKRLFPHAVPSISPFHKHKQESSSALSGRIKREVPSQSTNGTSTNIDEPPLSGRIKSEVPSQSTNGTSTNIDEPPLSGRIKSEVPSQSTNGTSTNIDEPLLSCRIKIEVPSQSTNGTSTNIDEPPLLDTFKNETPTCSENEITTLNSLNVEQPDTVPDARYVGDLTIQHFSTPQKAKRSLDMINHTISSQRKKIKVLRVQKCRLHKVINNFKELLQHLVDKNKISKTVQKELMES
ncbi:unnamed protein product [Phyllotreta striolata]|uniref:THAP-type domain-containing protein n=1 Tax=Phyllotreta striolata TaxID=444603 RepID=A0A9N9XQZ7_PHYSR|nr:unnamed protein product [Phyllotreta striolata]